jgi:hypothetical protein
VLHSTHAMFSQMSSASIKAPTSSADVAILLKRTLGAVTSASESRYKEVSAQVQATEAKIAELTKELAAYQRPAPQADAATQTNEGGSPAFEALQERVKSIEQALLGGTPGDIEQRRWAAATEELHAIGDATLAAGAEHARGLQPTMVAAVSSASEHYSSQPHRTATTEEDAGITSGEGQQASGDLSSPSSASRALATGTSEASPPSVGSPQFRAPPAPPGSRSARPPVRVELPVPPRPPPSRLELRSPQELPAVAPLDLNELDAAMQAPLSHAPFATRLARCEALLADANAWQARASRPLRGELDGLRALAKRLADGLDALSAHQNEMAGWAGGMQSWADDLSVSLKSALSALQQSANEDRETLESRVALAQVQLVAALEQLERKPDRDEIHALKLVGGGVGGEGGGSLAMHRMHNALELKLMGVLESKADRADLRQLEDAVYDAARPRAGVTGAAPLHDRLALVTPFMSGILDLRTAAARRPSPPKNSESSASLSSSLSLSNLRQASTPQRPTSAAATLFTGASRGAKFPQAGKLSEPHHEVRRERACGSSTSSLLGARPLPSSPGRLGRAASIVMEPPQAVGTDGIFYINRERVA